MSMLMAGLRKGGENACLFVVASRCRLCAGGERLGSLDPTERRRLRDGVADRRRRVSLAFVVVKGDGFS